MGKALFYWTLKRLFKTFWGGICWIDDIKRENMQKIAVALLAIILTLSSCRQKPVHNVVFIVADNITTQHLSRTVDDSTTQYLDSLRSDAIRFTNVFQNTTQRGPLQAILLSGQHPLYNGVFANGLTLLPAKGKRWGGALLKNGYTTGFVGSWIVGDNAGKWSTEQLSHHYGFQEFYRTSLENKPAQTYREEVSRATGFIKDHANDAAPFALFVSLPPLHPEDSLKGDSVLLYVQQGLHHIVQGLKQSGTYDNTLVVLTSAISLDSLHVEEMMLPVGMPTRAPLLLKLPFSKGAGTVREGMLSALDVMPSVLGLLNISVPGIVHGRDLSREIFKNKPYVTASVPWFQFYPDGYRGAIAGNYFFMMEADSAPDHRLLWDVSSPTPMLVSPSNTALNDSLQRDLERKTGQWMQYYEDEAYSPSDITEVKSIYLWSEPLLQNDRYMLPVDELKKLHGNRIMNFHGNNSYE